jgi:hypothetical protein
MNHTRKSIVHTKKYETKVMYRLFSQKFDFRRTLIHFRMKEFNHREFNFFNFIFIY